MPLIDFLRPTRWYDLEINWQLTWAPDGADAPIDQPVVFTGTEVKRVPGGAGLANAGHDVFAVFLGTEDFSQGYNFVWHASIDPEASREGGNTLHLDLSLGGKASKKDVTVPPWTETPFLITTTGSGGATGTKLAFEGVATTRPRRGSLVSSAVEAIRRLFSRLFPHRDG